jgi:hypothetical protein
MKQRSNRLKSHDGREMESYNSGMMAARKNLEFFLALQLPPLVHMALAQGVQESYDLGTSDGCGE